MSEYWLLVITAVFGAVAGIVTTLDFAIREHRHWRGRVMIATPEPAPRMRWRVLVLLLAFLAVVAAAVVYPKLSEPAPLTPFTVTWLTKERQDTFKLGAGSIINASGNFSPTKIETVAEPESGKFASALLDMFITSGLPIQTDRGKRVVGVPSHRLDPGVTIVAPSPSLAAETVRVGFERIGIQTRRSTKGDGDYLIVEVGPAP